MSAHSTQQTSAKQWPAGQSISQLTRTDSCIRLGHPGVTYNPWLDRTWCICGQRTYPGQPDSVDRHLACCGGPLTKGAS